MGFAKLHVTFHPVASCGKSSALPLSFLGRVEFLNLPLTIFLKGKFRNSGGGYPVKGKFRLATLENFMFVLFWFHVVYLLFISLAPTPSFRGVENLVSLRLRSEVACGYLHRGEGNFNGCFGVVGFAKLHVTFHPVASCGKSAVQHDVHGGTFCATVIKLNIKMPSRG